MNAHAQIVSYLFDERDPTDLISHFRQGSQERKHLYRKLELDWPFTPDISFRLSEVLTGSLRAGNQVLFFHCMDHALVTYERSASKTDTQRLAAFCSALIETAARALYAIQLSDEAGNIWEAASAQPLSHWIAKRSPSEVRIMIHEAGYSAVRLKRTEDALKKMLLTESVQGILEDD